MSAAVSKSAELNHTEQTIAGMSLSGLADSTQQLHIAMLPRALLATSPLVLMRALEMAFPLGMRSTLTIPPADSALSNSLYGHTASRCNTLLLVLLVYCQHCAYDLLARQ